MKQKLEKLFWLEEDELDFTEVFEATLGVLVLFITMFLPFLSTGGF